MCLPYISYSHFWSFSFDSVLTLSFLQPKNNSRVLFKGEANTIRMDGECGDPFKPSFPLPSFSPFLPAPGLQQEEVAD